MIKRSHNTPVDWAAVLALAGAATAVPGSSACAFEPEPYINVGAFVNYTFAAEQPWGMGLEARVGATGGPYDRGCSAKQQAFYYGGGALRWEGYPDSHARLMVVAQGGRGFAMTGGHAELGFGYRFGTDEGLQTLIGAELDYVVAAWALRVDPFRGEVNPAFGVIYPSVMLPYELFTSCGEPGRPLRSGDGYAPLPAISITHDHSPAKRRRVPAEAVALWGRRAQAELASVPAFRELAEQLRVLGAPVGLIERCHQAARDELRHALLAANQCAVLGDQRVELEGNTANVRPTLAGAEGMVRLAVESWIDGCLGEGVAAACAAEEAQLTSDESLRRTQQQIARDEAQHAELAWDALTWALRIGGSDVRHALHAVAEASPPESFLQAIDSGFEPFGILSGERHHALSRSHRTRCVQRLRTVLSNA